MTITKLSYAFFFVWVYEHLRLSRVWNWVYYESWKWFIRIKGVHWIWENGLGIWMVVYVRIESNSVSIGFICSLPTHISMIVLLCGIQMNEHAAEIAKLKQKQEPTHRAKSGTATANTQLPYDRELEHVKNLRCRLNNNTNGCDDSFFSLARSPFL